MMQEPHPAAQTSAAPAPQPATRNLMLRVISSAVLAPAAIVIAYLGGWIFALFWTAAAIAVWWEWTRLVHAARHQGALVVGICALGIEALLLMNGRADVAAMIAALGALAAAIVAPRHPIWTAAGVLYASALLCAPILLRGSEWTGFLAVIFVFAIVWATDILAYFVGRAMGGPKLAPSISPNKTWSGAIGGTLAAVAAGTAVALPSSVPAFVVIALVAAALSVTSQSGDLFESRMKRLFNVKDSGGLIPGHGGVMDRLDGFVPAAFAALLIGVLRAGWNAPGQGLIGW